MKKEKKHFSIIIQVAILFLIGVLITGVLTYVSESYVYDKNVKQQTEIHAAEIASETKKAVTELPANKWLMKYWYEHADELDIEYDVLYDGKTKTAEKARLFSKKHPELQLEYMDTLQCSSLPEEDQKLYAEITYSWLITHINQLKQSYNISFLFLCVSDDPFDKQFFLVSGADPGAKRGTKYLEVYPLGHTVTVAGSQQYAMRRALEFSSHLADAGDYVDYYSYMTSFGGHYVFIGLTYDLSEIRDAVQVQTQAGAQMAILNQLILSGVCLLLISLFVLRPVKRVQKHIRSFTETKDSEATIEGLSKVKTRNEIGQLADDVSEMVNEINDHISEIKTITADKERIQTELELATRIQAAMLPSDFPAFPDRNEFDLYAAMDPAREVGGDFYDFYLIDDDHLALTIADVSGKGVPAALFMMVSKILLKNYAKSITSPAKVLEAVNNQICANNKEEMFVTVWLGIFEISTGKLIAANAGHEYPVIMHDGTFSIYKDKHGLVIGGMAGVPYKDYEIQLNPGDKLFVYTDGVPEATTADNQMFGLDRLIEALNNDAAVSPEQILKNVREAVNDFVQDAEQFDDLTMLCFEYKKKED